MPRVDLFFARRYAAGQNNLLIINLDESRFTQYLQSLNLSEGSLIYIAASDGIPLSTPAPLSQELLNDRQGLSIGHGLGAGVEWSSAAIEGRTWLSGIM